MISAKRMAEIFVTRGGSKEFLCAEGAFSKAQLSYLRTLAEGEPIIAKKLPEHAGLVLTISHLVIERSAKIIRLPLEDIHRVDIPRQAILNSKIKIDGGNMDLVLRNGASLRIGLQPGGPYFGLLNVLLRIATINCRKPRVVPEDESAAPTTNDRRPTTPS